MDTLQENDKELTLVMSELTRAGISEEYERDGDLFYYHEHERVRLLAEDRDKWRNLSEYRERNL